jgi:hypothetical protein
LWKNNDEGRTTNDQRSSFIVRRSSFVTIKENCLMSALFEHGYALIVGVDANQIPRLALPAVAKDVQAVYDVLIHPQRCAYKPENVRLLCGADSTNKNILDGLYWLKDKVKGDVEATAVIYYSGHGMVDKATNQYYLVPYDIPDVGRLRADAIKAETLTAEISDIRAKRLLAILDCCHAGGMDVKDVDLAAVDASANVEMAAFPLDLPETNAVPLFEEAEPGAKNVSALIDGEGRAILNSSTGAQSSYVRVDGAMSLFTYHLIEALTGHASQPDDSVVYVTDVMSWVTRRVKESAKAQNRNQSPVMKTSGVFPIAQVIGGMGVAKGIGAGQPPPDPLAPLPPATTTQAEGSIIGGSVDTGGDFAGRDMIKKEGGVHIDGGFNMSGGSFVGGDSKVVHGDEVHGDKVGGDKVGGDKISVGNISGSQGIAIGRGARADVRIQQGPTVDELAHLFAPLLAEAARENAAAVSQLQALKAEVEKGEEADDDKMADLIGDIAEAAPSVVEGVVNLFTNSIVAKVAGGGTKYVLRRLRK